MKARHNNLLPKKEPQRTSHDGQLRQTLFEWRSLVRECSLVLAASTWILSAASLLCDSVRNLAVPDPLGMARKAIIARRTETRPYSGTSDLGSS
jgi:hypothetical protein